MTPSPAALRLGPRLRTLTSARPRAWMLVLVAAPLVSGIYLLLPTVGPARTIAYPAFGLIGMAVIFIGVHRRRPARAMSWRLIAVAFALLSVGDITYSILSLGGEVAYPSPSDIPYMAGYGLFVLGVVGLVRGRVAGGDRTPLIDAAILAAGAASIFWVGIVKPGLEGIVDPVAATVSLAYPSFDLALLALGARVLFAHAARPRYLQLLLVGIALYFVADVYYAVEILNASYVYGSPVDAGWILGVLLVGAAALHPSVSEPVVSVEHSVSGLSRARLVLLGVAALLAPTIILVHGIREADDTIIGLAAVWIVLFALVLARLANTVSELVVSLVQRRRLQGDLAHQATHDSLTGLANRALFEMRLDAALADSPATTAVIFLDLDDFKAINDSLGHPAGDELLREVADRLKRGLRGEDIAARLGGDEFALLVEGCEDPMMPWAVAERVLGLVRGPVVIDGRELFVRASAGVAMGRVGSLGMDLMRDADIAMYRAKATGKDHVEAYEAAMHRDAVRDFEVRSEMAEAIDAGAFVVHYQPFVALDTGVVVGAEALVRWNHPERGLIAPLDFIPQAEASGLIHPLGRWILREACATAAAWPANAEGVHRAVSVNLSTSQLLEPGLDRAVAAILAETGLPADRLVLEVTETALIDMPLAALSLARLRALGVQLALDDFGTGYSALSYLAELPFNIVKIDQSFVAGMSDVARGAPLLEAVLVLCQALKLITVAEGIEQPAQLARLRALGCAFGQGYLLSRPVPADELTALLTEESPARPVRARARELSATAT